MAIYVARYADSGQCSYVAIASSVLVDSSIDIELYRVTLK